MANCIGSRIESCYYPFQPIKRVTISNYCKNHHSQFNLSSSLKLRLNYQLIKRNELLNAHQINFLPNNLNKNDILKKQKFHLLKSSIENANIQKEPTNKTILKLAMKGKQFLPMCILFCLMAFCNTVMSNLGLSLIVTAPGGGAEILPYLTLYVNLPASMAITMIYAYLSHHMKREHLFTLIISAFIIFQLSFVFILYPHHYSLHLHEFAETLSNILPQGLSGFIGMIRNWIFTFYYTISELWGDVGVSLLFWGFANEITDKKHAHVLYPLFGIAANFSQVIAGFTLKALSIKSASFSAPKLLTYILLMVMMSILVLHNYIARQNRPDFSLAVLKKNKAKKKIRVSNGLFTTRQNSNGLPSLIQSKNNKKSFKESIKTLLKCPQIKALTIMTIAQSLSISIMEFVWKFHLKLAFPTQEQFMSFMGEISAATGLVTLTMMLMAPMLFSKLNWRNIARITPVFLTYSGYLFFAICFGYHLFGAMGKSITASNMLPLVVICGTAIYIVSRSAKFSLYKPAEEMVYITLEDESRTKGKAVVDVAGVQLGKSAGSLMEQILLVMTGGKLLSITPVMFSIYQFMVRNWIKSVDEIAEMHDGKKEKEKEKERGFLIKKKVRSNAIELANVAKSHFIGKLKNKYKNNLNEDDSTQEKRSKIESLSLT